MLILFSSYYISQYIMTVMKAFILHLITTKMHVGQGHALLSSIETMVRPTQKRSVFRVTWPKYLGWVGRFLFLSTPIDTYVTNAASISLSSAVTLCLLVVSFVSSRGHVVRNRRLKRLTSLAVHSLTHSQSLTETEVCLKYT